MLKKYNQIGILLAVFLFLGAGCNSLPEETIHNTYNVQVTKSASYRDSHQVVEESEKIPLDQLMKKMDPELGIQKRNGQDMIVKLDGVIATASKEWKLYINNIQPEFTNLADLTVHTSDQIEWRYEEK